MSMDKILWQPLIVFGRVFVRCIACHVALQCSPGEAWCHWSNDSKEFPIFALSYNHRASAFYRADAEHAANANVVAVRTRGLKRVRVLAAWTPEPVLRFMAAVHNRFHQGSGASVVELCHSALHVEASWRQSCERTGLTYSNPKYQKTYEA